MHPELFKVPFINLTVKSYGFMLVIGFLSAVFIIRRLSKDITPNPDIITNAALYSLIAGVVGARIFYVVHYFERFRDNLLSVFAIWQGGLELLGGVILAITVLLLYMRYHKLPIRKYLDILAVGLMVALAFGRIGCFLNGCCFGKPSDVPWGVTFPYGSIPYENAVFADPDRNRQEPYIDLPDSYFFSYLGEDGEYRKALKSKEDLTEKQLEMVEEGKYSGIKIHPTQLYSSLNAALLSVVLYLLWKRSQKWKGKKFLTQPGCIFSFMLLFYSVTRFFMEFVRDDNPYEFDSLTISQNITMVLFVVSIGMLTVFSKMGYEEETGNKKDREEK